MKLYHGTVYDIENIDLSKSNSAKDFGKGFYLSPDRQQAERWAIFKSMQLNGIPKVYEFDFDESLLKSGGLSVKVFEEYCGDKLTEKDLCNHGFSGGRSLETPNCNNKKLLDYIKSII